MLQLKLAPGRAGPLWWDIDRLRSIRYSTCTKGPREKTLHFGVVGSSELFRPSVSSSGEGYPEHRYTPLQCVAALTAESYREDDRMMLRRVFEKGQDDDDALCHPAQVEQKRGSKWPV
jgi:hypothetical protein